ncbi:IS200/IS605 family accessory protein TnpB-related protein [Brevibacillus massiliensis]|uniref:IS200/IS605 family accessory protein TnpB-related protein n=1 Tax=Brevibacillus massiliensis TaxID=1118054 RepID=UPI00031D7D1B|nr:IS200/IS605 family accessory protein TnpB-related protein [Brevibacillus massiliensis]
MQKDIVDFALQFPYPVVMMEKLENIRKTAQTINRSDRTIHSWAFYQLQQFIAERATKMGIPVLFVNPAYTKPALL